MRKRYFNLTFASVVSAIAVVYMHVNSSVFQTSDVTRAGWLSAHFMISVCYFAVPVFFMITGATLMDYRERYSTKTYFFQRVKKTVIPFFIWSIVALLFQIQMGTIDPSTLSEFEIFKGIFSAEYLSIYWFFLNLFCLYLLIPVLSLIPKENRMDIFLYVLVVSFVLELFVPFLNAAFGLDIPKRIRMHLGTDSYFFLFAGYYLQNKELKKKHRYMLYAAGIAGFLIQFIGTWKLSVTAGKPVETLRGSAMMPNALYSIAIFVLLKQIAEKIDENSRIANICKFLSGYTFGIYLIHRYLMLLMERQTLIPAWHIVYRVLTPGIFIAVCIGLIWLIRKIPIFGEWIVP